MGHLSADLIQPLEGDEGESMKEPGPLILAQALRNMKYACIQLNIDQF